MLKRILSIMLVFVMLMALAVGCGSSGQTQESAAPAAEAESPAAGADEAAAPEDDSTEKAEAASEIGLSGDTAQIVTSVNSTSLHEGDVPVYGGTITLQGLADTPSFDQMSPRGTGGLFWWAESLWGPSGRATEAYDYSVGTYPMEYYGCILADSYSMEGNVVTVNLRQDVYFQDKEPANGRQMVATDVKLSYDRLLGLDSFAEQGGSPMWIDVLGRVIESIEVVDDFTVKFHLFGDNDLYLYNLVSASAMGHLFIMPQEWIELEDTTDWTMACGTGPFILTSFEPGVSMEYVKNENYWRYDPDFPENKLPYLDGAKVLYVADSSTLISSFLSGSIDGFGVFDRTAMNYSQYSSFRNTVPEEDYNTFTIVNNAAGAIAMRVDRPPFDDIRVRKALQYALDCDALCKAFQGLDKQELVGLANPAMIQYSGIDGWSDELKAEYTTYDPELAKELLAEAGYPDGFEFSIDMSPTNANMDLMQAMQAYWAAIGVTATFNLYDTQAGLNAVSENRQQEYAILAGRFGMPLGAPTLISFVLPESSSNYYCHDDQHVVELADAFYASESIEESCEAFKTLEEYVVEQHWSLMVGNDYWFGAYRNNIKGLSNEYVLQNPGYFMPLMWVEG